MSLQEQLDQTVIDAYILFHAINSSTLNDRVIAALRMEYEKKLQEIDRLENTLMGSEQ